jgi:hypothetical protein
VITGATEFTNVSVFSVGRITAGNQALFRDDVTYGGTSDIAFIAIVSSNGKFGGVRTSNTTYFASKGYTGVYAPSVQFVGGPDGKGPVFIGDIIAFDNATPVILLGAGPDTRITGGDLSQANGQSSPPAVQVSGISQLNGLLLPAQANKGVLQENGADVTAQIVVNPGP